MASGVPVFNRQSTRRHATPSFGGAVHHQSPQICSQVLEDAGDRFGRPVAKHSHMIEHGAVRKTLPCVQRIRRVRKRLESAFQENDSNQADPSLRSATALRRLFKKLGSTAFASEAEDMAARQCFNKNCGAGVSQPAEEWGRSEWMPCLKQICKKWSQDCFTGALVCQHGGQECDANRYMACAKQVAGEHVLPFMSFAHCPALTETAG